MKLSTSYALMEKLYVSTKMSKFDPCAPPAFTHGVCAQSLPDVIQWGTFCQHGFQYREM